MGTVGGDVEEVPDLIEEGLLALHATGVLAHHHNPVGLSALLGLVGELGDVFVVESEVEEATFGDDVLCAVMTSCPGRAGGVLIGGRAVQPLPHRRIQGFGPGTQGGDVVHAEHDVDLPRPPVDVGGQLEVGVSPQTHPLRVRRDQADRLFCGRRHWPDARTAVGSGAELSCCVSAE